MGKPKHVKVAEKNSEAYGVIAKKHITLRLSSSTEVIFFFPDQNREATLGPPKADQIDRHFSSWICLTSFKNCDKAHLG